MGKGWCDVGGRIETLRELAHTAFVGSATRSKPSPQTQTFQSTRLLAHLLLRHAEAAVHALLVLVVFVGARDALVGRRDALELLLRRLLVPRVLVRVPFLRWQGRGQVSVGQPQFLRIDPSIQPSTSTTTGGGHRPKPPFPKTHQRQLPVRLLDLLLARALLQAQHLVRVLQLLLVLFEGGGDGRMLEWGREGCLLMLRWMRPSHAPSCRAPVSVWLLAAVEGEPRPGRCACAVQQYVLVVA